MSSNPSGKLKSKYVPGGGRFKPPNPGPMPVIKISTKPAKPAKDGRIPDFKIISADRNESLTTDLRLEILTQGSYSINQVVDYYKLLDDLGYKFDHPLLEQLQSLDQDRYHVFGFYQELIDGKYKYFGYAIGDLKPEGVICCNELLITDYSVRSENDLGLAATYSTLLIGLLEERAREGGYEVIRWELKGDIGVVVAQTSEATIERMSLRTVIER